MAFPLLAVIGLGALVFAIAKGSKPSGPQRPGPRVPGKDGCYALPAYGGAGRDLNDLPPTPRAAFEAALTTSRDPSALEGVGTTLDCLGYRLAGNRFRARAAELRRGLPINSLGSLGDGRTVPPVLGPTGLVPGCVPPIGWAQPPSWIPGQPLSPMDAASWPGMPPGYALGSPLPSGAPCPSGWDDARLGDLGVDGLPEPLRGAVQKALATGTNIKMLEDLAQHLDAMGQGGAASAVRAKIASLGGLSSSMVEVPATFGGPSPSSFGGAPGGFTATSEPFFTAASVVDTLPDPPKSAVKAALGSGDPAKMDAVVAALRASGWGEVADFVATRAAAIRTKAKSEKETARFVGIKALPEPARSEALGKAMWAEKNLCFALTDEQRGADLYIADDLWHYHDDKLGALEKLGVDVAAAKKEIKGLELWLRDAAKGDLVVKPESCAS